MKTKKLKLFITLISPIIILYLICSFIKMSFSIIDMDRWCFVWILALIFSILALLLFAKDRSDTNFFQDWFKYDELEIMKKKNTTIREMNKIGREQLELLKQSDDIRKETKDLFSKNKI